MCSRLRNERRGERKGRKIELPRVRIKVNEPAVRSKTKAKAVTALKALEVRRGRWGNRGS